MTDEEVRLVDVTAELESQIEMPDWLNELGPLGEGEEEEDWLSGFGEEEVTETVEETADEFEVSFGAETIEATVEEGEKAEMPDWLREMRGEETAGDVTEAAVIEEGEERIEEEEEIPAEEEWIAGLEEAEAAGEEEIPDWLREMQPTKEEAAEEVVPAEEIEPLEEEELEEEDLDWLIRSRSCGR